MKESTHKEVARLVSAFIDTIPEIDVTKVAEIRQAKPFQAAMFGEEALLYAKQERTVVTNMGKQLFPGLARTIAMDSYTDVRSEYSIEEEIDSGSLAQINTIVAELRQGGKKKNRKRIPNHAEETELIQSSRNGMIATTRVIADLYVGDHDEGPLFMEIKTPMPNIDVCAQSKHKILVFEELRRKEKGRGYLAFAYNPYITRDKYKWSITKVVMDLENEVLIGSEMWDKLGGPGTFSELLKVLEEVGEMKRKELKEAAKQQTLS